MNRGRPVALLVLVAAATLALSDTRSLVAFQDSSLAGRWVLNRALSQFPREVGFGMDVIPPGTGDRAGTGADALAAAALGNNPRPISETDARNTTQLVAEVKNPPNFLEISQTANTVTLVDGRGRTRTFHTDGRDEFVSLEAGPVTTIARWDGPKLVVRYKVQPERELRYTLSRHATAAQLIIQVQFVERGGRDVITRIYEPAKPGEPIPPEPDVPAQPQRPAWQQAPAAPAQAAQPPAGAGTPPPAAQGDRPRLYQPGQPLPPSPQDRAVSPDRAAGQPLDQRPGAEFKGLTSLGVVVEDLGATATSCGLRKEVLESTVTKSLTDAGLRVVTNSDEDTYLYVRVTTSALSTGFCFSRYDAMLYTHTTAALTYGSAPALVQVELLRNGGLAGGGAAAHADSVVRNLKQYVDAFAARIRDANK